MRPPPDVANLREAVAATVLVVQLGDQGGGGRGRTTRSTLASWSRKAVAQPIARPGPSKVARMPPPMLLSGRPPHRSTGSLSRSSWTHRTYRPPTAVAQLGGLESRRCWWTAPWPARGWAHGGAARRKLLGPLKHQIWAAPTTAVGPWAAQKVSRGRCVAVLADMAIPIVTRLRSVSAAFWLGAWPPWTWHAT